MKDKSTCQPGSAATDYEELRKLPGVADLLEVYRQYAPYAEETPQELPAQYGTGANQQPHYPHDAYIPVPMYLKAVAYYVTGVNQQPHYPHDAYIPVPMYLKGRLLI